MLRRRVSSSKKRFLVPVCTIHAGPNPKYFNRGRGVTWYNLLSDQATGLNAITVPGTLRDSLVLLSVVLEQQTELQPTHIMTDTGAYSDVVFGLFRLLGYRFCPRLADIGGTRFWRIDSKADYGELNSLARQRVSLERVAPYWDDVMRLIGSLKLGRVSAMNIMRTLQVDDSPTHLAQADARIGQVHSDGGVCSGWLPRAISTSLPCPILVGLRPDFRSQRSGGSYGYHR